MHFYYVICSRLRRGDFGYTKKIVYSALYCNRPALAREPEFLVLGPADKSAFLLCNFFSRPRRGDFRYTKIIPHLLVEVLFFDKEHAHSPSLTPPRLGLGDLFARDSIIQATKPALGLKARIRGTGSRGQKCIFTKIFVYSAGYCNRPALAREPEFLVLGPADKSAFLLCNLFAPPERRF